MPMPMPMTKAQRPGEVAEMMQEMEFVSWLGFPEVAHWQPFAPMLTIGTNTKTPIALVGKRVLDCRTESLVQAVGHLMEEHVLLLVYRAFPRPGHVHNEGPLKVTHELSRPLFETSRERPRRIERPTDAKVWCKRGKCWAYFILERTSMSQSLRLSVGGTSASQCAQTWRTVGEWISTLIGIHNRAKHGIWGPRAPRLPPQRRRVGREERERNEKIRETLAKAAKVEAKKQGFHLRGRGHEPRVSLTCKVAAILRGNQLPCTFISGFGTNHFYPRRVFARGAAMLEKQMGRPILAIHGASVVFVD